ncbi:MAG: DNA repair protein RecO [Deltaproteobacteria bacterium]|nr:DNA repair protein RecO [Deltaproteobacteria bacterium]
MKPQVSQAIILHHTDYGEADRIVTFLTPDQGRLKGFARAARKSRKRFGAALEPFAEVQLHWAARSSGDLVSLRDAELVTLRSGLRRDLETLTLASYGCELTEVLFDESGASVDVFQLLQAFLDHLDSEGYSVEARLLLEIRLLSLAGYVPHLQHCADCFGPLPNGAIGFSAAADGSLCPACDGGRATLKIDRMTLGTFGRILQTPLTSFADFKLSPRSRKEGQLLLNDALRCHLHRPLKSLEFLNRFSPSETV